MILGPGGALIGISVATTLSFLITNVIFKKRGQGESVINEIKTFFSDLILMWKLNALKAGLAIAEFMQTHKGVSIITKTLFPFLYLFKKRDLDQMRSDIADMTKQLEISMVDGLEKGHEPIYAGAYKGGKSIFDGMVAGAGDLGGSITDNTLKVLEFGNMNRLKLAGVDIGTSLHNGIVSGLGNLPPMPVTFIIPDLPKGIGPKGGAQAFATGGFIEDGLFTMNRGEMAGTFNDGTSVVANNNQIADGIAQALYPILAKVVQGGNKGGGNVYIDGSIAGKLLEKHTYNEGVRVGHLVPQGGR